MSYRRKAPAAASLSVGQQLQKVCNASLGNMPFQAHNALFLLTQLRKQEPQQFQQFSKKATPLQFLPAAGAPKDAPRYSLPLPEHPLDPEESSEDLTPREFYLAGSGSKPVKESTYLPRCGLTGFFFRREEVVDNLRAASSDLGFTSPFWLKLDHPALLSGYLKAREAAEPIAVSLTDNVVSVTDVPGIDVAHLHPSLHAWAAKKNSASVPELAVGMNALSGFVSKNPVFASMPLSGAWVSFDQLLQRNIPFENSVMKKFKLVEVDQWLLLNADQLTNPGRLGLRQSLKDTEKADELFQPL